MAKLKGQLPLKGTIQNITFAETGEGIIARSKSSLNRKRLTEDASFERTREQNKELGASTSAGKLLRQALERTVFLQPDSGCVNRLTSRMARIVKTDLTHGRGQRKVAAGMLSLLKGFEFNADSMLYQRLLLQPTISYERASGVLTASWPSMLPAYVIDAPKEATHIQLVLAGTLIDFSNKTFDTAHAHSAVIPLNHLPAPELVLTTGLPEASHLPLIACIGLEFLDLVNDVYCPLERGRQNAMGVVEVG